MLMPVGSNSAAACAAEPCHTPIMRVGEPPTVAASGTVVSITTVPGFHTPFNCFSNGAWPEKGSVSTAISHWAAAAAQCEIAVLTLPFSGQAPLLKQLKGVWKPGTVVIDTTVPLAATVGGSPTRMIGVWQGSAAQAAAELLPAGVSIAAAFQNLGAELLAGDGPVDCDVLVCSDDDNAKKVAMELAAKIPGVRALNGGKLENARIVESITALLIGLNIRHKVHSAGVRFTGLPTK